MRFRTATIGAKNRSLGSPPPVAYAVTRASGFRPCTPANASDVTTSALAPSFKPGAFPGVTEPPVSKEGLSAASASRVVSARGHSSFSTTVGPFFPGISTATVSALKRHAAIAATAFWWLSSAKRSWSARDTPAAHAPAHRLGALGAAARARRADAWGLVAARREPAGDAARSAGGGMEAMSNAPHYVFGMRAGIKAGNAQLVDGMIHDGIEGI